MRIRLKIRIYRDKEVLLQCSLPFIGAFSKVRYFLDSGNANDPWKILEKDELSPSFTCEPRGGFLLVIER